MAMKALKDLQYHIEGHFYIKDKRGRVRPIKELRRSQRMFLALIHHIKEVWADQQLLVRILILKSRKTGISTIEACRQLIEVLRYGYDAAIIAQDLPTAQYIHEILKRAYEYYDLPKHALALSNKRELKFKNREGYIEVFTANQIAATRGRTPQIVHGSEVAHWEKGSDAAVSLFQAVANELNTSVVMETTANGDDSLFKPLWDAASDCCSITFHDNPAKPFGFHVELDISDPDNWNGFFPLFISAIDDEDCRLAVTEEEERRIGQTLDEYELMIMDKFNAPIEFIKWLRKALRLQCQGDVRIRKQEYPITPEEAFIVSGDPRFDIEALDAMPIEPGLIGYLKRDDRWDRKITFCEDRFEKMTVFKSPVRDHRYVIAIDTAEGRMPEGAKDPDESVAQILDIDNGPSAEQVGIIAGQLSEEDMVDRIALAGEYFNMAFLVPEWTGGHGEHLTIQLSKIYPIDRIYHRMDPFQEKSRGSSLGLQVTVGNRNRLIADLAESIAEGSIRIHDKRTVRQCRHFVWNRRGRIEAAAGHHDDRVFALIGAIHGWKHYPRILRPSDGTLVGLQEEQKRWPIEEHIMDHSMPDPDSGY